jgi:hypothetical protein
MTTKTIDLLKVVTCLFLLLGSNQTISSQKHKRNVDMPYIEPHHIIGDKSAEREPYILLFENDSLFQKVRSLGFENRFVSFSDDNKDNTIIRIDLYDFVKHFYLHNKEGKIVGSVFPNETGYELQWFTKGKNSMLKQWEMVDIHIKLLDSFDENGEFLRFYEVIEEKVMTRRIDRIGAPEDFELTITYLDKDTDGVIDKIINMQ